MTEEKPDQGNWSDREIFKLEQDRFGAQDYADVLAKRAANADTPLTIGIYGRWGSGKTSLMRLIEEGLSLKARLMKVIEKEPEERSRSSLVKLVEKLSEDNGQANLTKEVKKELKRRGNDSLIRNIDDEVPKIESIWINVWQLSSREELWNAFLQAIFTQVHKKLPRKRRWAFDWSLFRDRVNWGVLLRTLLVNSYRVLIVVTPLLLAEIWPDSTGQERIGLLAFTLDPFTGGLASLILGLWLVVAPAVQAVKDKVSIDFEVIFKENPYEIQVSELQRLQDQFERLVEALVGENGRLVIFIDDLDRCTPDKVPEVLEAIKLFTNTPRCVYLIGLDHEIVRQGVQTRYEFREEDEAAEYLEKIIQIPFRLPGLEEDLIGRFVEQDYADVGNICSTAPQVFSKGMEPNPRKVKRVLNVYRTLWELAGVREQNWEMDPVDPELLAKMVVLQSRFSDLHDHFRKNLEDIPLVERYELLLARKNPGDKALNPDLNLEDKVKEGIKSLRKESVPERDHEALSNLFTAGEQRFYQIDPGRLSSYIYLTGTAEGEAELLRPSRQEREALLSNDRVKVRKQVAMILERAANDDDRERLADSYLNRLQTVIDAPEQYSASVIESASYAQAWFEVDGFSDFARLEVFKVRAERLSEEPEPAYVDGLRDALKDEARQKDVKKAITDLLVALDALSLPQVMGIPAGPFQMGASDKEWSHLISVGVPHDRIKGERPQHEVILSGYRIGKYPVTNREYRAFVRETGHRVPEGWEGEEYPEGKGDHPVVEVSWEDAMAYCNWLSGMTGYSYRLPTEAEWEKAARGEDGRVYPWGDEFNRQKANTKESNIDSTTPVGQFSPQGDSPYGVADMAGNVLEWCADWYDENEYRSRVGEVVKDPQGPQEGDFRVLHGGAFDDSSQFVRCAYRYEYAPVGRYEVIGFRVVVSPSISEL
jgi:iron(II)-dependent oxidoreductase